MSTPSCSVLELNDFMFKNNTCSGRCGVILSSRDRLRNVRVRHVRVDSARAANSTVFYAGPQSTCWIKRMRATENGCSILHVDGGTLNVSGSTFARNEIDGPSGSGDASCIHLMNATVLFENSQFLKNRAEIGCAVAAWKSNLTIRNCAFEENKAKQAAVIHLTASTASIQSSDLSANEARRSAGVLMALESQISIADSSFEANAAGHDGGCFYLQSESTIEMVRSSLSGNGARNGGVAFLDQRSVGNVLDSSLVNNSASSRGGSFVIEDSRFSVQRCRFQRSTAKYGACICANLSNVSVMESTASRNNATDRGGYFYGRASEVLMSDCSYIDNVAGATGGVVDCRSNCTFSDARSKYTRNAANFGGAICLNQNSTGIITNCRFEKNNASTSGGGVYLNISVVLSVLKCRFTNGYADRGGGGIYALSSRLRVKHTFATHLEADFTGGFINAERSKVRLWRNNVNNNNAWQGGGVAGLNGSSIVDTHSVYSQGEATFGAALHLETNSSGTFTNCRFTDNAASGSGGAIYAKEESSINLRRCLFSNGSANYGGLVYARASSRMNVTSTEFGYGSAYDGGCLCAENSFLSVQHSIFQDCNALKDGGAVNLDSSVLRLKTVDIFRSKAAFGGGVFAENAEISGRRCGLKDNHADQSGGSFYTQSSTIRVRESILDSNAAFYGGGGYWSNSSVIVQDSFLQNNLATYGGAMNFPENTTGFFLSTTFTNNSAVRTGGSLYIEQSKASFQECILQSGVARYGGLLLLWNASYVNIGQSTLKDSNATWGGCVRSAGGNLTIHNATMQGCRASAYGGAVSMVDSSTAIIANSSFVSNRASYGAFLHMHVATTVIGDRLIMRKNEASEWGGAIYGINNTLHLSNSLFEGNSARAGGAMSLLLNAMSVFSNVTFANNWAIKIGGSLYSEESVLILSHCLFRDSSAQYGGLLFSWRDVLVNITKSDLVRGSAHEGGCVSATMANLAFWRTSILNCSASGNGGGLLIEEGSSLQLIDSSIEGNRAVGNGGGLSCTSDSVVHLEDSNVIKNIAQSSQGLGAGFKHIGSLINVNFVNNSAAAGGHCHLQHSSLGIAGSRFSRGDAKKGGGFFVSSSSLNIADSELSAMKASVQGGVIFSEERSSVVIENSFMISGSSAVAGAVALMRSDFRARHVRISQCEAKGDGGAIWGVNSSRFLCIDCVLRDNSARRGGSIYFEYADAQSIAVQLVGSTVQNNSATFGGIFHRRTYGQAIR